MSIMREIRSAPSWITIVAVGVFAFSLVWIRHKVAGVRIQLAGGTRAPVLAANLLSATKLYIDIGTHQYNNKLAQWCNGILDSKQSNYAEFSLTGKKRVLITREPEQIKAILATKFANFGHGPQWHRLWRPFLGKGIFATDGDDWHRSRGLIRPMFVKDRLRNLVIFDNCTRKLLSTLPPSGTTVDIKDVFYRWTLDTTTEFLLGENTNSLDK
ncbi:cytochrome P450 alkane hydroxylase, partial [Metarhizium brunneum ARSEF 3297]